MAPTPPPSVDALLRDTAAQAMIGEFGRMAVTTAIRQDLDHLRALRRDGQDLAVTPAAILARVEAALVDAARASQRPVFNLTGTVLHTNLGRALIADEAVVAAVAAMRFPTSLEYDLTSGERGERDDHVGGILRELTGAEDVCLVNNNAAAVLLVLATFSRRRETIVSRGELVEIGGAFRIPEVMRQAGAVLREVGATNRTHLKDYESALGNKTALVMKVHASNYAITGFTAEVSGAELAALATKAKVPFVEDLGSGTLIDLERYGLPHERTVQDALKDGADLVTFSGDKLLGGPQAGFIAGRRDLVRACAKNHLKRALRLDKMRLAMLEATLKLYRDPDRLAERLPTIRLLARDQAEIGLQAMRLKPLFASLLEPDWSVDVVDCRSQIGSGALPVDSLPSAGIALTPLTKRRGSALKALAARWRALDRPIIGRIAEDRLILDLRCLDDEAGFVNQLLR